MKKENKKLRLNKETIGLLNGKQQVDAKGYPAFDFSKISKTEGTIYNCPSYPFACKPPEQ